MPWRVAGVATQTARAGTDAPHISSVLCAVAAVALALASVAVVIVAEAVVAGVLVFRLDLVRGGLSSCVPTWSVDPLVAAP